MNVFHERNSHERIPHNQQGIDSFKEVAMKGYLVGCIVSFDSNERIPHNTEKHVDKEPSFKLETRCFKSIIPNMLHFVCSQKTKLWTAPVINS